MNKKIRIEKKLEFSNMVGEICAISLENHLDFIADDNISGNFIVFGRYKSTSASRIEEDFKFEIPVDINLTEKLDTTTAKVDVENFYYDLIDDNVLICYIELEIDGVVVSVDDRECDGDSIIDKNIEIPHIDNVKEEIDIKASMVEKEVEEREEDVEELELDEKIEDNKQNDFFHFSEEDEEYGTFLVYIIRNGETLNTIIEKYHVSVEEVEKYNDIKNITTGSKVIIPLPNEKDS